MHWCKFFLDSLIYFTKSISNPLIPLSSSCFSSKMSFLFLWFILENGKNELKSFEINRYSRTTLRGYFSISIRINAVTRISNEKALSGCYSFYDVKNVGNGICTARRQINRKTIPRCKNSCTIKKKWRAWNNTLLENIRYNPPLFT